MNIKIEYYIDYFKKNKVEIWVDDNLTDEQIEKEIKDYLFDRLGTTWEIEED